MGTVYDSAAKINNADGAFYAYHPQGDYFSGPVSGGPDSFGIDASRVNDVYTNNGTVLTSSLSAQWIIHS